MQSRLETISVEGLDLLFDPDERDAAELIRQACEKSARIIHDRWGLDTPGDCRVYVMTSWLHFVFHSAPWHWCVLLALSMPLQYFRLERYWRLAGGWTQRYGKRIAVGVKPPRLAQLSDTSVGERIFVKEDDMDQKVQHITCHELVHAFAAHLRLPMWLNEGLAMATVDEFIGKPSVQPETVELLARSPRGTGPGRYRNLRLEDRDALVYHCVRGYWVTRYLEDTRPDLLRSLLSKRRRHHVLEDEVAAAFGMTPKTFWEHIDGIVASHFKREELPNDSEAAR